MEIASLPAIAGGFPPEAREPISPELVLIDPELRRALQARPLERPPLQLVREEPPALRGPAPEPGPPRPVLLPLSLALERPETFPHNARRARGRLRRRLVPILLPMSLALNAALIASAVSDSTSSQPAPTPASVTTATSKPSGSRRAHKPAGRAGGSKAAAGTAVAARPPVSGARNAKVERRILGFLVESPAGKLPAALIDPNTGLAKNNLQAVCRRNGPGSFLCLVRPQRHKPGEGLYVRYRATPGRPARITWYRYRNG
jgi:hypothetical protein